ncbi:SNF2 family N-terminal domain-containing protein [Immersiella caudata]|uniref:SNF2 family N-terminal domain-containing protein n=1 Tax=Immersiella caudata TaxID=314043 RepID=A0AA39WLI7_9PEZI|nr:SNF2 family N-terminal domain-containing protein [Immersiella caudata]
MADASDSPSSGYSSSKRRAPKESAEQQETPRKRIRPTEGQQASNRSSLPPPAAFPEGVIEVIDLTASDDEDVVMESSFEGSPAASLPYDTCFGLLKIPATILESKAEALHFPVKTEFSGKALKLSDPETGIQIGSGYLSMSIVLFQLKERARVSFTAAVSVAESGRSWQYVRATLRLVVFGFMAEKSTVAKVLSDGDLYLQHPSLSECGSRVPYFNPHYLVRPGGSMPRLENLAITDPTRPTSGPRGALTEIEKNMMLQIFESAHDPDAVFGVRPSSRLQTVLKDHQISALAMMIERECGTFDDAKFPSLWEARKTPAGATYYQHVITNERQEDHPPLIRGGVLADEMGLGKSLSAIALILWHIDFLESINSGTSRPRPTLIVAPKSTLPEWDQQFQKHVRPGNIRIQIHHGANRQKNSEKWRDIDVVLTTYDTLRSESCGSGPLSQMEWARIILDEAHTIRNPESRTFAAAEELRASCRWCLTGTPIQNKLEDFAALVSFIRVPRLESVTEFQRWISDPFQKKKKCAFDRLRALVKATCLRRTKRFTASGLSLPKKEENTVVLDLEPYNRELYNFFKRQAVAAVQIVPHGNQPGNVPTGVTAGMILPLINNLRRICDHGEDLLNGAALEAWRNRDVDLTDWQLIAAGFQQCDGCAAGLDDSDESAVPVELPCGHRYCTTCCCAAELNESRLSSAACSKCSSTSPLPTSRSVESSSSTTNNVHGASTAEHGCKSSVKVDALLRNLDRERSADTDNVGDGLKSVVFSCWTKMLDLIEKALQKENIGFQRIDGQTTLKGRADALEAFRSDPNCHVMLATIGSVGEGVNLVAASFVHIMEPHWNPMAEAQAVDRVHRIGQHREVLITRYLIKDSIEFYVRGVQQDKIRLIQQSLSSTEVSQKDIDRDRFRKLVQSLS